MKQKTGKTYSHSRAHRDRNCDCECAAFHTHRLTHSSTRKRNKRPSKAFDSAHKVPTPGPRPTQLLALNAPLSRQVSTWRPPAPRDQAVRSMHAHTRNVFCLKGHQVPLSQLNAFQRLARSPAFSKVSKPAYPTQYCMRR
jgi:hypothetical protein